MVLYKTTVLLQGLKVHKTKSPASPPPRLLDANIQRLRYMHYSLRTDQAYVYWVRYVVRWWGIRHRLATPLDLLRLVCFPFLRRPIFGQPSHAPLTCPFEVAHPP
jgi:hypothetical protein